MSEPITGAEMADLVGGKLAPKLEIVMVGERLFHRDVDGQWWEYPADSHAGEAT